MTVQVLGTGQTGNWELSHWLTQFSMVLIGREESCDVETAAVKRAVRTWRPGKGCGRGAAREGWSGVGKTGKWWMRQRWTRACLLALQVTMECKDGRRLGACEALATAEELNPFNVLQWIERSTARLLDQTTITLVSTLQNDAHTSQTPTFLFLPQ